MATTSTSSSTDSSLPSLGVQDIVFVVFKHKWKIIFFTLLGLGAAAAAYFLYPPSYESYAKLLVRYVLDRNVVDSVDSSAGYSRANDNAIAAEVEILTSWDLALQVAQAVGIEQLVPGSKGASSSLPLAAQTIQRGIGVSAPRGNVILISYRSNNPALATNVLQELVNRYFIKHLEVHRSAGAFDFVTQQADQVHGRLSQTEEELKRLKDKLNIISLADSVNASGAAIMRDEATLAEAETERAEQVARLQEIQKSVTGGAAAAASPSAPAAPPVVKLAGNAETQEYQALVARLGQMRQTELDLLSRYTAENPQVQVAHSQIADLERRRAALAVKFPDLAGRPTLASGGGIGPGQPGPDLLAEHTRLAALDARVASLKTQLQNAKQRAEQLAGVAPQITQLERQKELEETNYRYFAASLEKARVDEALDPSKIPNISVVQKPTVALRTISDMRKTLLQLALGGLGLGLGLAFLIEMVFDQTIKRASEFERRLRIPLLLSIPKVQQWTERRSLRAAARDNEERGGSTAIQTVRRTNPAPWEPGHFIRPYAEAIRDRLGLFFELNDMTHKPKLVAITGFAEGGGISTIAGGIAAALSEMGEGKVLLVDMNIGHPELHSFYAGKPAYSLMTALHPACPIAPAADNLYLATTYAPTEAKQVQIGPKRLYELMPSLKASNFDYIIFDMPSLDQSSVLLSMAGLMDKVLLVAEAEKCSASLVRRAYQELTAAKARVSCVLNKTQSYGPKLIEADA